MHAHVAGDTSRDRAGGIHIRAENQPILLRSKVAAGHPADERRPGESSLSRSISTSAGKLKGSASMSSAESAGDCTSEKVGGQPVNVTPSGVRRCRDGTEDLGAGHIGQPEGDCRLAFDLRARRRRWLRRCNQEGSLYQRHRKRDGRSVASDRDGGARRKSMRGWPSCRGGRLARRRRPRRESAYVFSFVDSAAAGRAGAACNW